MFNNPRYITRGIHEFMPQELQIIIWEMIDRMTVKQDYLQVFEFSLISNEEVTALEIIHRQEQPDFKENCVIFDIQVSEKILNNKVFCIDDIEHSTMLFSYEY